MQNTVTIIGAGVSGLTCGVLFAERGFAARIVAEEFGARTTSGVAAAIWFPYDAEPVDRVIVWSLETFDVLKELSGQSGSGVSMIELRCLARVGEIQIPPWAITLGASRFSSAEVPANFTSGFRIEVPLMDTTLYLDYLAARFRNAGGDLRVGTHLAHLEDADDDSSLLVNCAGFGAGTLVPDPELEPHRGQVVIVPKISQTCAVVCDDEPLMYAIPRGDDCVFGGTNDVSTDRSPDSATSASIIGECSRVLQIAPPRAIEARVGLRPSGNPGFVCMQIDYAMAGT